MLVSGRVVQGNNKNQKVPMTSGNLQLKFSGTRGNDTEFGTGICSENFVPFSFTFLFFLENKTHDSLVVSAVPRVLGITNFRIKHRFFGHQTKDFWRQNLGISIVTAGLTPGSFSG